MPESSTNTGSEVFAEPRGLNKLLWKEQRGGEVKYEKKKGGGGGKIKWRLCWLKLGARGASESWIRCFSDFNQKQRRSAVEKSMTKSKVHMS